MLIWAIVIWIPSLWNADKNTLGPRSKVHLENFFFFLFYVPATKWRRAYSFTLHHTYVCPYVSLSIYLSIHLSVTIYNSVRVSATSPTFLKVMVGSKDIDLACA